jgi:hypothetical protein
MTEPVVTTGATASHDTETTGVARLAAQVRSLRLAAVDRGTQEILFAAPPTVPAVLGEATVWRISIREPTDDESDFETRMIENNPDFYERLVRRIRSAGETVPAEDALGTPTTHVE